MPEEKKSYRATPKAGPFIAARRTPTMTTDVEVEGRTVMALVPDPSIAIELTEEEARYELLTGAIEPMPEDAPATLSAKTTTKSSKPAPAAT